MATPFRLSRKAALFFAAAWALGVTLALIASGRGWLDPHAASILIAASAWIALVVFAALEISSRRVRHHIEERTRRTHGEVLSSLRALSERIDALQRDLARLTFDPYAYWQDRARQHGRVGVGDLGRPRSEFDAYTTEDKEVLIPFLKKHLTGHEQRLLDFGCGFGRFTHDLSVLVSEHASGVDATPELLEIARTENASPEKVSFHVARGSLPFPDSHFDVVWVSYVMIHIVGAEKDRIVSELHRVLKPGGLLFLVEGVTLWRTWSPHCDFRSFDWYRSAFQIPLEAYLRDDLRPLSGADIKALMEARREVDADLHLVMIGRKPAEARRTERSPEPA